MTNYHRYMRVTKILENYAKSYLPSWLARAVKRIGVHSRYLVQAWACREGFRRLGHLYSQDVLFIAGLPKSGTTWLKKMVASYPGFHELLIPDVAVYELATGGSHDYELPSDMFSRFNGMLVVTKMHVHGSLHNVQVLGAAGVRHVVLYRDLRDVAVSHFFYVRQTPWHPEYPIYSGLSVQEGLAAFAERTLLAYVDWVRLWQRNRDPEMSLVLQYEQMLSDPMAVMTRVAQHFELDSSPETIATIVDTHSFQKLSEGRKHGQESTQNFFRKGVAGDWRNHFTPTLEEAYKHLIGDFLIEFGYEQDYSW
jgi:hypothetical protein